MDSLKRYWESRYRANHRSTGSSVYTDPDALNSEAKARFADIVIDNLQRLDGSLSEKRVLCVGSGPGLVSSRLAKSVGSLYGIDFSRTAVQQAKESDELGEYCQGTASYLPFTTNFDIVSAFSVLYHITDDQLWENAIMEMSRVVKDSGYVLCRINWEKEPLGKKSEKSHFYERPRSQYKKAFKKAGLSIIDIVDLPIRPIGFQFISKLPKSNVLKQMVAPGILAGGLWTNHQNKLIILQS
ncbi:class I SAM-dependent methyltransferase [Natronomonas amylolytica]|uniref:class I SAM-dependent methyltransferase n=1 Tax=Natronomonas amylolytica TaxID=3108498 RepID=UPI00300AFA71